MHESHLIQPLVQKILSESMQYPDKKLKKISISLGALSLISKNHFIEHFIDAVQGSSLEGITLEVIESSDLSDPNAGFIVLKGLEFIS